MSDDALAGAVTALVEKAFKGPDVLQPLAAAVIQAARTAGPPALELAAGRVAALLDADDPGRSGFFALTVGALVEAGCPPGVQGPTLLEKVAAVLAGATRFVDAVPTEPKKRRFGRAPKDPIMVGDTAVARADVQAIYERDPVAVDSWHALEPWVGAAVACLTRDAELRKSVNGGPLAERAAGLAEVSDECRWLDLLASVLDDEPLLVLEPAAEAGWRFRLGGVSSNFQLHVLLADAIGRARGEPPPPDRRSLSVARGDGPQSDHDVTSYGVWNLYQWTALDGDGRLPADGAGTEDWVWNEGAPSDVDVVDGQRVLVLGPPYYERSFSTVRDFDSMRATLTLEEEITPEAAVRWLRELGRAAAARRAGQSA